MRLSCGQHNYQTGFIFHNLCQIPIDLGRLKKRKDLNKEWVINHIIFHWHNLSPHTVTNVSLFDVLHYLLSSSPGSLCYLTPFHSTVYHLNHWSQSFDIESSSQVSSHYKTEEVTFVLLYPFSHTAYWSQSCPLDSIM